jgi:hypothetical protein
VVLLRESSNGSTADDDSWPLGFYTIAYVVGLANGFGAGGKAASATRSDAAISTVASAGIEPELVTAG